MADVEWNLICRVCLQEGEMTSINSKDETNKTIREKIVICSPIRFQSGSTLPEHICSLCLADLSIAYRFYSNCESTEAVLKSITENFITEVILEETPTSGDGKNVKSEPESEEDEFAEAGADEEEEEEENEQIEFLERFDDDESLDDSLNKSLLSNVATEQENAKFVISYVDTLLDDNILEDHPIKMENFNKVCIKKHPTVTKKPRLSAPPNPAGEQTKEVVPKKEKREWTKGGKKSLKICEICGNSYKYAHALESHMRRHRGEKPFECDQCGKAFVIAFELKRHMRTHTGQKPYQCKYCDRAFSDFGSRIKHERSHTGERPYVCTTCGKAFAYSHVLTSHTYIHTGEKKFGCEVCGKRFTKSHHLKAHSNIHTRAVVRRPVGAGGAKKHQSNTPVISTINNDSNTVTIEDYTQLGHNVQHLNSNMLNNLEVITIINPSTKPEPHSDDDINGMIIEQHVVGGDDISVGGNETMEHDDGIEHMMHVQYK